jgi:hypothetical protein
MILEELLVFDSEEDADTFCNALYERGGEAKKTFRGVAGSEEIVTCNLKGYIDWFREMVEGRSESNYSFSEEEIHLFQRHRDLLERTCIKLTEIMQGKKIGDVIYTRETLQTAILSLLSLPQGKIQERLRSPEDFDTWIPIDIILKDNHVVIESPEGYRLDRVVDPGSLLYQNTLASESAAYKEAGKSHKCIFSANHSIDPECVVIIGPPCYLCCTDDEIAHLLTRMAVDEVSLDLFSENFSTKRRVLTSLLDIVRKKDVVSRDVLIKEMVRVSGYEEGEESGYAFHLSPRVMEMIVDELMRAKILSGTDKKIRIGKAIRRRR